MFNQLKEHTAQEMLNYHLNEDVDLSSRNKKLLKMPVVGFQTT